MKKNLILITLLLNVLLLSSFVSAGWFTGKYSGNVVITGDFTEDSCNTACGTVGGKIDYPGDKSCDCNPKEVIRQGNQYCTDYADKKVCGRLGEKITANDGTKILMTRGKGGFFKSPIIVTLIEPFKELPKNA